MPVVVVVAVMVVVLGHCRVVHKGQSLPSPVPPNLVFNAIAFFIAPPL
jgi:hypothetical protein